MTDDRIPWPWGPRGPVDSRPDAIGTRSSLSSFAGVTLEWADGSETSSTGGGSAGVRSFAQTLSVQLRYVPFVNNSTYVFSDEAQAISSSLNTAQSNTTATGATDSISTAQARGELGRPMLQLVSRIVVMCKPVRGFRDTRARVNVPAEASSR